MELQLWLAKIDIPGLVPGLWNHLPDCDTWCSGIPDGLQPTQLFANPKVVEAWAGIIYCLKYLAQLVKIQADPPKAGELHEVFDQDRGLGWRDVRIHPPWPPVCNHEGGILSSLPSSFIFQYTYTTCQPSWILCRLWTSYLGTSVWSSTTQSTIPKHRWAPRRPTNDCINLNILCKKQHLLGCQRTKSWSKLIMNSYIRKATFL